MLNNLKKSISDVLAVSTSSSKPAAESELEPIVAVFGVLSDVQYADVDDKHYGIAGRDRFYRNSVRLMRKAVDEWMRVDKMKFVVQLGDLVDSQAKIMSGEPDVALKHVLSEFEAANVNRVPLLHIWGNHEMYNFDRKWLANSVMNTARGLDGGKNKSPHDPNANYYRYDVTNNLSLLCLDLYRFSLLGYSSKDTEYQEAYKFMRTFNPNKHANSSSGLSAEHSKYVAFNGALGTRQTEWLECELADCQGQKRRVIVCGHVPVHSMSSCDRVLAWDADNLVELFGKYSSTVVAYLAGHFHPGGYFYDAATRIHYVTFKAMLETAKGNSFATVYVYPEKVKFVGVGEIPSFQIDLNE